MICSGAHFAPNLQSKLSVHRHERACPICHIPCEGSGPKQSKALCQKGSIHGTAEQGMPHDPQATCSNHTGCLAYLTISYLISIVCPETGPQEVALLLIFLKKILSVTVKDEPSLMCKY